MITTIARSDSSRRRVLSSSSCQTVFCTSIGKFNQRRGQIDTLEVTLELQRQGMEATLHEVLAVPAMCMLVVWGIPLPTLVVKLILDVCKIPK